MQMCSKCHQTLSLNLFSRDKARVSGYHTYCKPCCKLIYAQKREQRLAQKKEYSRRPEVKKARQEYKKEYYQNNREFILQQRISFYSDKANRQKMLFFKSRERAQQDNIQFTITLDDIIIPDYCPYLKIKLTHHLGQGQLETNSSLDRIDSSKGYIPGNVQVISRLANTMKNSATPEQLRTFANSILEMQGTTVIDYAKAVLS